MRVKRVGAGGNIAPVETVGRGVILTEQRRAVIELHFGNAASVGDDAGGEVDGGGSGEARAIGGGVQTHHGCRRRLRGNEDLADLRRREGLVVEGNFINGCVHPS